MTAVAPRAELAVLIIGERCEVECSERGIRVVKGMKGITGATR
jgi:hypothetical protein